MNNKYTNNVNTGIYNFIKLILENNDDFDELSTQDSLIESGRLASINIIEIIALLEAEYDIDFSEVSFDLDNFETIDLLLELVDP